MYYFFFRIKFHVGNENTVYDRKHLYIADMKKKMLGYFSYVQISCVLILEIFMEISIGLEGENICRNLM